MTATAKKLPTRLAVFHGLGSIAYGIKDNGFSTFLLLYCNLVLGMDPRMVSLALMVALVIDGEKRVLALEDWAAGQWRATAERDARDDYADSRSWAAE